MGTDHITSEEESYTTDSLVEVIAEFKRDKIPGNAKGELIQVASIIDNEQFGNLYIEKLVNWSLPLNDISAFEG